MKYITPRKKTIKTIDTSSIDSQDEIYISGTGRQVIVDPPSIDSKGDVDTPKKRENVVEKNAKKPEEIKNTHKQKKSKQTDKTRKRKKRVNNLKESKSIKKVPKKRREVPQEQLAKLIVPEGEGEYRKQENKLKMLQKEIEESGYVLNQENSPKILQRDSLKLYEGFRIKFQAKQGASLQSLEEMIEKNLEEKFAKNFRRIYRGKMSKIQEGVHVVDFIPQEYLQTYKKKELNRQ